MKSGGGDKTLMNAFLKNAKGKDMFLKRYAELMGTALSEEHVIGYIDKVVNLIKDDMVLDRETAIKYALDNARKGDLIMLLGKGHELYNEKNGVRTYFNERDIVKKYMA